LDASDCQPEGKEGKCVGWQNRMSLESIVQLTLLYPLHQQENCGMKNTSSLSANMEINLKVSFGKQLLKI
jgi:hypothetical protein